MEWYYAVILFGVLALMYVFMIKRQKNQEKRSIEIMNSFQVGDKVVTHIGVYGRIKKIYNTTYGKVCVLEIGTNNKLDIELDMRFIAGRDEKTLVPDEPVATTQEKVQEKTESNEADKKLPDNLQQAKEQDHEQAPSANKRQGQSKKRKK